jgi:hypothetical protein
MKKVVNFRQFGDALLRRVGRGQPKEKAVLHVPKPLDPHLDAFEHQHAHYAQACDKADEARETRDLALEAIGLADAAVDTSVEKLANVLVGAGLGERRNPFEAYSPHSVSQLCRLPYAKTAPAVRDLVGGITARKPSADVLNAATDSLHKANVLDERLQALMTPQAMYEGAMKSRDLLLLDWTKAIGSLKIQAKAALANDPGTLEALLALPPAVTQPKQRRRKAKDVAG